MDGSPPSSFIPHRRSITFTTMFSPATSLSRCRFRRIRKPTPQPFTAQRSNREKQYWSEAIFNLRIKSLDSRSRWSGSYPMKAVVLHEYGGPEKLKFEAHVPDPQISGDTVLIAAVAA